MGYGPRLRGKGIGRWPRCLHLAKDPARDGVRALRRAARIASFQTSQLVALGITEVEIEADLTFAAVQRETGRLDGLNTLIVAAAAARALSAVAAKTEELRDAFGLEIDGPFAEGSTKTLTAFLGGPLLLESELARALDGEVVGDLRDAPGVAPLERGLEDAQVQDEPHHDDDRGDDLVKRRIV